MFSSRVSHYRNRHRQEGPVMWMAGSHPTPPVKEPSLPPNEPPIQEPDEPPEGPFPPEEPPMEEPPDAPQKPPVKEPPADDPNRTPPHPPQRRVGAETVKSHSLTRDVKQWRVEPAAAGFCKPSLMFDGSVAGISK